MATPSDRHHADALKTNRSLAEAGERYLVHNYVVVESAALLQRRGGLAAAEKFLNDAEAWEVAWVDAFVHREARDLLSRVKSEQISFVDCASFVVMRRRGITKAFAFDRHFEQQGFSLA